MDMIGKMYRIVEVKTNAPAEVAGGGSRDNYSTAMTIRAEIKPNTGNRAISFGEIMGNDSYVITTRYSNALWAALNPISTKFVSEGQTYTLQGFNRKDDRRKAYIVINVTLQKNG